MVAQDFFGLLAQFNPSTTVGVEDFSDRFNFLFTVIALLLCIAVVTIKQYLLRPISCYMSTSIGGFNLLNYVENYCWIHGTIPINIKNELSIHLKQWENIDDQKMDYYQWVPFVLSLQCIMFYLPRMFWQMMTYYRTGTDLQHLIVMSVDAVNSKTQESHDNLVRHIAKTMEHMLFYYREHRQGPCAKFRRTLNHALCFFVVSKRLGTWLVMWYVITKLMYLGNAIGQLYLMQRFLGLGSNYSYFGINVAENLLAGRDWRKTMLFPRVTFCHVSLKNIGSNNHVVAQCVLPVNMLNEKIYIFLWFWIVFASVLTFLSIPLWLLRLTHQKGNARFIRKYLKLAEILIRKDKPLVEKFVRQFLRHDGVFLLRMMSLNAGDMITSDIVIALWKIYREKYKNRDFRNDGRLDEGVSFTLDIEGKVTTSIPCIPSAPQESNHHGKGL